MSRTGEYGDVAFSFRMNRDKELDRNGATVYGAHFIYEEGREISAIRRIGKLLTMDEAGDIEILYLGRDRELALESIRDLEVIGDGKFVQLFDFG